MQGLMTAPAQAHTSLMRMSGTRTGRGWMELDRELERPSVARVLWLFGLIAGVIFTASVYAH